MKILMTADAVGGVWTYALELVSGLAGRGVTVHLAVMGPVDDDERLAAAAAAGAVSVHHHPGALEWMADPWGDLDAAGKWLLALQSVVGADLVHLNSFVHASLDWSAPVVSVGHSCVLSWWEAVNREPAPLSWERYRDAVTAGLEAADAVVAPSGWMLQELSRLYGVTGGRVIYNGVDTPRPPKPRQPVVIAAGRLWDEAKNVRAVLEAAPRLRWPVAVAGTDKADVANARALGSIPRAELLERLSSSGVFVHPARYEPFGLGPLEAALCGCALVLGDIPSLRELWDGAALFVDPDDPDALVARCNELIDDDALRVQMADRGHDRALTYSRSAMTSGYLSLYSAVMQPSAAGAVRA